jgi:hypothetical protein
MTKKTRPETLISPTGIASYPHLNNPDTRFSDQTPQYKVKLRLDPNDKSTQDFIAKLEQLRAVGFEELKKSTPKYASRMKLEYDVFKEEFDKEGNPTGFVTFEFKCKAEYKQKNTGKLVKIEPKLIDSKNKPFNRDTKIGGGSRLRVAFTPIPFAFSNTKVGLSLRLEAVQVIELATYGGASPFDEVEGGFSAEDETFSGDDKLQGADQSSDEDEGNF